VNRLIGLQWLAKIVYPDMFTDDLRRSPAISRQLLPCDSRADQQIDSRAGRTGFREPCHRVNGAGPNDGQIAE